MTNQPENSNKTPDWDITHNGIVQVCPPSNYLAAKVGLLKRISQLFIKFLERHNNNENPMITMTSRLFKKNIEYKAGIGMKIVDFPLPKQIVQPKQLVRCLKMYQQVATQLTSGDTILFRTLFYKQNNLYEKEKDLRLVLHDVSYSLQSFPTAFNIFCESRGVIAAKMYYEYPDGKRFYCDNLQHGVSIPNNCVTITRMKSGINFIIVLEKLCVFEECLKHTIQKSITAA